MNRHLLDDTVHKINSDDTKPLNTLIGETNSLISSQHSNTNSLINTLKAGNVPVVKSVQRGVSSKTTIKADTYTINISAVNMNKSILIMSKVSMIDPTESMWDGCYCVLTSSTKITIHSSYRNDTYRFPDLVWQVIEFY